MGKLLKIFERNLPENFTIIYILVIMILIPSSLRWLYHSSWIPWRGSFAYFAYIFYRRIISPLVLINRSVMRGSLILCSMWATASWHISFSSNLYSTVCFFPTWSIIPIFNIAPVTCGQWDGIILGIFPVVVRSRSPSIYIIWSSWSLIRVSSNRWWY